MGFCASVILTVGLLLILLSLMIPTIIPILVEDKLNSKLLLRPDSEMHEKFVEPPADMYLRVYFFNITNPDEVEIGKKAILDEVGPYTYRQVRIKVNLQYNHSSGTVSFNQKKYYFFEQKLSNGYESDIITTINPIYLSIAKKAESFSAPLRWLVELLFLRFYSKPIITKLAGQLLFHGFEEEIIFHLYDLTRDPKYETGRFGFFHPKNGSKSKQFEIFTGEHGMQNYQNIYKYNEEEQLSFWKRDYCNMLNGTDGAQFPRPLHDKRIYLFTEDLCRSIYADFEKVVHYGSLRLNRYTLPPQLLDNSTENSCFCHDKFTCRASMIDISSCKDGAPIVISTPHFYQGNEGDRKDLIGLNPVKEKHETFLDIEPTTGVTLRANKRIQINIVLKRYGDFPLLDKISETVFPILWVSESASASESKAEELYEALNLPRSLMWYGSLFSFSFGVPLIILGCILLCKTLDRSQYVSKL